jgi:hypothetical protein
MLGMVAGGRTNDDSLAFACEKFLYRSEAGETEMGSEGFGQSIVALKEAYHLAVSQSGASIIGGVDMPNAEDGDFHRGIPFFRG